MKLYGFPWWFIMIGLIGFAYSLADAQGVKPGETAKQARLDNFTTVLADTLFITNDTHSRVELILKYKKIKGVEQPNKKIIFTPFDKDFAKYEKNPPRLVPERKDKVLAELRKELDAHAKKNDQLVYWYATDAQPRIIFFKGSNKDREAQVEAFWNANLSAIKTYAIKFDFAQKSEDVLTKGA